MLDDLEIVGLGVIEHAELPLRPGFTAITGETGAGKTMVVTALGLLLGGRASAAQVRQGAERARIDARVVVDPDGPIAALVDEIGGELEHFTDECGLGRAELLVARQVAAGGRSRAWLGGQAVPAGRLAELGDQLVAVHGQSDQLRLAEEPAQRAALDALGGDATRALVRAVEDAFAHRAELQTELDRLRATAAEREAERGALRDLVDAVDEVGPAPDEDAQLLARIDRLSNREELRERITHAHALLAGDERPGGTIRDLAREAHSLVDRAHRTDPSLERTLEAAIDLDYAVDELTNLLAGYLVDLDTDGLGELDSLNERLALIADLKRRFDAPLEELLERSGAAGLRLQELAGDDTRIPQLAEEVEAANAELQRRADALTESRQHAAAELSRLVTDELAALAMPLAEFAVAVQPAGEVRRSGQDRIEFRLQANPGSEPLPLAQGASGGELSRVMLALEVVLAGANPVPTLVFDEVDAGVGGAAALEIGARLQQLAESSQVIVVTHLAQVAAYADHHIRIAKSTDGEVTTSSLIDLDDDARIDELTRLLSGLVDSTSGRTHAQELLRRAARSNAAARSDARDSTA